MHQHTVTNNLLQVRDLSVQFRIDKTNTHTVLHGISFDVPRNTTVALVGESGSGKSVSALAVMGLLPRNNAMIHPASNIIFNGQSLLPMTRAQHRQLCGKELAMIFQEPMSSLNPVLTVGFQIAEVLCQHMGMTAKQARSRVIDLLDEVGIPDPAIKIDAYPNQLSGGQQQRVMIAMAIACEPKLLIADEPTTALDVTVQRQIMELIIALQKKHQMSVLLITHDLALVREIADQVLVMRNGEIRERGEVRQIFDHPVDSYTKALLHCRPSLASRSQRLPVMQDVIEGKVDLLPIRQAQQVARTSENILVVNNLNKRFVTRTGWLQRQEFCAVQDASFALARGKTLGIVGESGSGKTTLGLTLLRLHQASSGEVLFYGQDLLAMSPQQYHAYKRRIQIVFQNPYASLNPRFTIEQILLEPMRIHQIGANDQERVVLAMQWLQKVGLPSSALHRYPHEFSGGQRQRIAIARCLTMQPEILVCDESVSALDVSVQAQVLNLLRDLQDEFGISYIFISHDLSVVKYMADDVMVMYQGKVVEYADAETIYTNPQHPYARMLLGIADYMGCVD